MTPKEYKQMMDYLTRSGIKNKVKFASDVGKPVDKFEVQQIKLFNEFNTRNPRTGKAGGGMLVQPGFGGTRQGYRESKPETITKISNFIEDFKLKKERLPSKNEIKVGLKIDSNTVANAVEQGKLDILPEREAKILGQSKILKKRQKLTLGKGKRPYVSVKEKGKGGKEVLWESETQKNQYINDLKKRFEGTGFRPQAYDAPTDYLTNKELAIKYFGSDSPANVQRINNINTELRKTENLKYIEVGDDEKKGGKDRRLERERTGTALLSDREKRINLAQDEYVKSLNNFFKKNPNKIKNYPKLIELINLSFDPKTGTIGSKNKTLDELKKYITSEGGLFDIEHISDLQYEKKNRQFPVNRQIAPQNVNKGFLSSVTAYIKNNKDNPQAQTQIKNIENTLKKYGLRIYVPETGTFGANMIGAYDQANKSFPNFDRIINNLGVKSPNFKFKEIQKRKGERGSIDRQLLTDAGKFLGRTAQAGFLTPTGVAATTLGLGGLDLTSPVGRLSLGAELAAAPELVKASIGATRGMKNRALQKGIQQVLNLGLPTRLALRAARVASPIGIATLAGEGLYQAGKFSRDRIRELQAMTPEQRQQLRAEQSALAFEGARDGGLIGKKSGPPPEKGPMSQGLPGLLKRVKKL